MWKLQSQFAALAGRLRKASRREGPSRRKMRGFTLVELLLVMFIMSVLVALVIGVGTYVVDQSRKRETVASQDRLISAIAAYRNVTNKVPPDAADPNTSIDQLITYLQGGNEADTKMKTKVFNATRGSLGENLSPPTTDAYGVKMRYYSDRGVGGKPLILSAGPDGDFGKSNQKKRKDNIRSDTRE